MDTSKTVRYLSLFSGIGAFERSVRDLKQFRCVGYSEIDKNALLVYQKNYPDHKWLGDVLHISDDTIKRMHPDLIIAGFPCTDISTMKKIRCAAPKRGLRAGGQSSLLLQLLHILQTACESCTPKPHIIVENVVSMSKATRVFITSCLKYVYSGVYTVHTSQIDGVHFSPQRRKRFFWTTFEVNAPPLSCRGPSFKSIADRTRNEDKRYMPASTYAAANKLSKCSTGGMRHTRDHVVLPIAVQAKKGWYAFHYKTFKLDSRHRARNRWSNDYLSVTSRCNKTRTLTKAGLYVVEYNKTNASLFKLRQMTVTEMHALFGFDADYCSVLGSHTQIKCALANSIVVGVLRYIVQHYSKHVLHNGSTETTHSHKK